MKILNRKAWWNYEKQKYINKIKLKEESLKLHIAELDKLRKENRLLIFKLNEKTLESEKSFCQCNGFVEVNQINDKWLCTKCNRPLAN